MDSDVAVETIPLPEAHTWDTVFLLLVSFLQYTRSLVPLIAIGGGVLVACIGVGLFFAWNGNWDALLGFLMYVPLYGPRVVICSFIERNKLRDGMLRLLDARGAGYVGLITHVTRLREILMVFPQDMRSSIFTKVMLIFVLMSWQELLGCLVVAAWAVAAFTPEFFTRNSPWPFWDMTGWALMQLHFLTGGKQLWPATINVSAACSALIVGGCALFSWFTRRGDLQLLAAIRRHELPERFRIGLGDSADVQQEKARRIEVAVRSIFTPVTIWERWAIPRPLLTDVMYLGGLVYGVLLALARNTLPAQQLHYSDPLPSATATSDPGEPHGNAWTSLLTAMAWSWPALKAQLRDWRVGVGALVAVWLLAVWRTRRLKKAWEDYYYQRRFEHTAMQPDSRMASKLATDAAISETTLAKGPYPQRTFERLTSWASVCLRVLMGVCWGTVLIGWVWYPGYLPAYAIPAYGAGPSGKGPAVQWVRDVGRGPRLYTTDSRLGGWWAELHTAARVNLLAVRAWRKGGLDGVQGAMEALRAAVHSSQMVAGPGPEPKEVHKHAVLTLLQLQAWGPSGAKWELGGKWSLGLNWERRRAGVKAEAKPSGKKEELEGLDNVDTDIADSRRADASGRQQCAFDPVASSGMLQGRGDSATESNRCGGDVSCSDPTASGTKQRAKHRRDRQVTSGVPSPAGLKTQATTTTPTVKAGPWWSSSLVSALAHLAVAGGLILGLVLAGPDWLKSPEKFLDFVASLVVGMRSARAAAKKKKKDDVVPARKKQADADKAGKKGKQQQQAATASAASQTSVPGRQQQQQQAEKLDGPESSAPSASSSTGSAAAARSPATAPAKAAASPTSATSSTAAASAVSATTATAAKAPAKAKAPATAKQAAPPGPLAKQQQDQQQQKQQQKKESALLPAATLKTSAAPAARDTAKAAAASATWRERPASSAGSDDVTAAADKGVPSVTGGAASAPASAPSGAQTGATSAAATVPLNQGKDEGPMFGLSAVAAAVAAALPFTSALAGKVRADSPTPSSPAKQCPVVVASAPAPASRPASTSAAAQTAMPSPLAAAGAGALPKATPTVQACSTPAKLGVPVVTPAATLPPMAANTRTPMAPFPPTAAPAPAAPKPAPAPRPPVPAEDDVPIPTPMPIRSSATSIPATTAIPQPSAPRPTPAPPSAAPPTAPPTVGLNPALAHFLRRSTPAPSAGAGAATTAGAAVSGAPTVAAAAAAASAPRGGLYGNVPGVDPNICIQCRVAPRTVCYVHSNTCHMCLCTSCGVGATDGDSCPVCGVQSSRVLHLKVRGV